MVRVINMKATATKSQRRRLLEMLGEKIVCVNSDSSRVVADFDDKTDFLAFMCAIGAVKVKLTPTLKGAKT